MTYEDRVINKCSALLKLILGIKDFYKESNYDNKRFIETTIGADIWYLKKLIKFYLREKLARRQF